mmetsp:Transcript_14555/g.21929  ORF Transcript_14555/g.21929 Transcript_14555/m.21929 type:complete len:643 (-) Transcript_14555:138-2066(-)|eukprot:CAMPEP_0185039568 /NCGR_PEP_ID=MMETSP1103-20130426/36540_1 /TAXON_ID=36769 /ORGANISM="Paraphysomonas bandaiensis, Strain Caron Lab Isolate" /LENGTH=642 /DNA_ID=CAMNT_0027578501 /DNA_START=77 /DNA_END=2005 /DNA_ORIENTATION=+
MDPDVESYDDNDRDKERFRERDREMEGMRQSLLNYLNETRDKKSTDGTPLVHFPENFDSIVNAMNRKDLVSESEKSWARCLLEERFDRDMQEGFEGGRYKELLEESKDEVAVDRGMAEIQLLDNQLSALNRKARSIAQETAQLLQDDETKSSARSRAGDGTFLTRLKTPGGSSVGGSPVASARSTMSSTTVSTNQTNTSKRTKGSKEVHDVGSGQQDSSPTTVEENETESEGEVEQQKQQRREAAEARLQALLNEEGGEDGEVWRAMCRFGYSAAEEERMRDIDMRIAALRSDESRQGRADSSDGAPALPAIGSGSGGEGKKTYGDAFLQQQRAESIRKRYSAQLDGLLSSLREEEIDLSGLATLLPRPPSSSSFLPAIAKDGVSCTASSTPHLSVMDIPSVDMVSPRRVVGTDDVNRVVNELCYSGRGPTEKADRSALDRLMAGVRGDVERLAEVRSQTRSLSRSGQSSTVESEDCSSFPDPTYADRLKDYLEMINSYVAAPDTAINEENDGPHSLSTVPAAKSLAGSGSGPALTRMTTLELKEAKNVADRQAGSASSLPGLPESLDRPSSAKPATTVVYELESIQERMNAMLDRASSVTKQAEEGVDSMPELEEGLLYPDDEQDVNVVCIDSEHSNDGNV